MVGEDGEEIVPKYIVAKLAGQVIIKRNRGENQKLLVLGQLGKDVFEIEAGSKKKALKKGLDMFPAQFEERVSTIGQSSQVRTEDK